MEEKVNLKKKIFNEYVYIVITIMSIYFFILRVDNIFETDIFDLLALLLVPIFILIAFIINPIRILISYKLEFKTISSKIKRTFYYLITILPILSVILIISFVLISDYMYGK